MPTTQLQLRRGNTAQTAIFTGAVGEVTVDTQKKTLIVHDGVTAGGTEIALKSYANAAYHAANNAGSTASDAYQHAGSASSYANGAFAAANTVASNLSSANTWLQTYVGTQISNLVDSAPTTLDTLNELAAALGDDANFSTTISNMVGVSGGYANSAYLKANAAYHAANNAGSTASDAYQHAGSASSYANSAYTQANTANQRAVTSGSYANSAFSKANTATILAQAAFNAANTGGGGGGGGAALANGTQTFTLTEEGNVIFSGETGGVNRGLVWDYGAETGGQNSIVRQDDSGLTVRAYTEAGDGVYAAPVNIVTNQGENEKRWTFNGSGNLELPDGGTISEGLVTSNPTIQLTPATPDVESQKLVIKGGGGYYAESNGIWINLSNITFQVGDTVTASIGSETYAGQTLYWWINPSGFGISDPASGTVTIDESGYGDFSFVVDDSDYGFTVRVSPTNNVYDSGTTGVESLVINDDELTDAYHLHLTTGDLTQTSIFLGTDNHNVRTRIDGKIQITTPNTVNKVWQFGTDGGLKFPDGTKQYTAYTGGGNNPGTSINLDFGTFNTPAEFDINLGTF